MDIIITIFTIALRTIWRNRKRSVFTVIAVAVGILSSSFLAALQGGARMQLEDDAVTNLLGHISMADSSYYDERLAVFSVPELSDIERLQVLDLGAAHIIERIRISAIIMTERESAPIELVGIAPAEEKGFSLIGFSQNISGDGRAVRDTEDDGIVLGERLLEDLKTGIGKRVVLLVQDANGKSQERGYRVVGAYKHELLSIERAYAFTGRSKLQDFVGLNNRVSEQSIFLSDRSKSEEYVPIFANSFAERSVKSWIMREPFLRAVVKLQSGVLLIWYGVVLTAVFFGVLNTLFMAIFEREKEFALYQALGMNSLLVVLQVVLETLILLTAGAFVGGIISIIFIKFLSVTGIALHWFSAGVHLLGLRSMVYPALSLVDIGIFIVLIFGVCLVGSLFPAMRASRMSPSKGLVK